MYVSIARCPVAVRNLPSPPVEDQIAAFLAGRTNGADVLHAIYDHVLEEPIPESMRRLISSKPD